MENNKHLPLRIIHFILIAAGIVLYVITLISFAEGASALNKASTVLNILALASGVVYLIMGYKKSASLFYKMFTWFFMISQIMECTSIFSMGIDISAFNVFITVFTLVAAIMLGGAKDYGKVKTNIVSIAIVVLRLYAAIMIFRDMNLFDGTGIAIEALILDRIGQLIIAVVAAITVCGKYLDKTARGAK